MSSSSPYLTPSYDNALHLLSLLQSNKTVINLFEASPNSNSDINASAIPEMKAWLSRAGYSPSDLAKLRCIHVAGTKGKGSVCTFTTSILKQYPTIAGKVGTYTSPHLASVRERICLDGESISREKFVTYFYELWNKLSDAARQDGVVVGVDEANNGLGVDGPSTKPFYFRFLTLLAFHAFLREGVKSAVIECGIGGEYDSTNVLPADAVTASVVTQLGIDHVSMLGDTVQKIAWHKAGIFKKGIPAYTYQVIASGHGNPNALEVMDGRAKERETTLSALDDENHVKTWPGVPDAMLEGAFQKANMLLATAVARRHLQALGQKFDAPSFENARDLLPKDFKHLPEPIIRGLRTANILGRCQTIREGPITWYLDGAHTEDSLTQVGKWYASKVSKGTVRVLVFNQQDRNSGKLLRTLLDTLQAEMQIPDRRVFHHVICSTNDFATTPVKPDMSVQEKNREVMVEFCPATEFDVTASVTAALDLVKYDIAKHAKDMEADLQLQILITGSFNLVGPALRLLDAHSEI
ncbi:folylpolyglutamate synthase [Coniella lustricola]|uniref:Folylpolyglutamate synthase n=1 Tax=Coniella lustricola TaxID=2025994 RepID=A0A2T3AFE5_9PEZI|nr:folylpolyglutamate synthase [Coniella lustricola]